MEIDMGIGGLKFGSGVTRFPDLVFVVVVVALTGSECPKTIFLIYP